METDQIRRVAPNIFQFIEDAKSRMDVASFEVSRGQSDLSEHMKTLRHYLGLSAQKFGAMCGITQQYVFALEGKRATWKPRMIICLNEALKNKMPTHTRVNANGEIEADSVLEIDHLAVDGLLLGEIITKQIQTIKELSKVAGYMSTTINSPYIPEQ